MRAGFIGSCRDSFAAFVARKNAQPIRAGCANVCGAALEECRALCYIF
jgi:hypothetical protein